MANAKHDQITLRRSIMENRIKDILRTSIIGIVINIVLALFKILLGTLAHSLSVLMDGINNLADAGSGLITMVGTALAGRPADKKHPFGYGRLEYLSSLVISGLILYAGITSAVESVKAILSPEQPDYSTLTLVVIAVAVFVKLFLALYTQAQGKKLNSDSMVASGKDALMDVVLSITTLVGAGLFMLTGLALEPYLAAVISLIIIKAGLELLKETISKIIGEPADIQLVIDIKNTIKAFPGVHGAFDLILNNYGPDSFFASVHVEVDDSMTVKEIDELSREVTDTVHKKHGVILTAVGFYSHNTADPAIAELETALSTLALEQPFVNGIHGIYANLSDKQLRFDLVMSFDAPSRADAFSAAMEAIRHAYPEYDVTASMDVDFNELKE